MKKLNLSVGILSWGAYRTLKNTLESYKRSGLFDIVNDIKILFQEGTSEDKKIAQEYKCDAVICETNVGIGKGLTMLAQSALTSNILLLENDWVCIEDVGIVYEELSSGVELLNNNKVDMVKYRHRRNPGDPLYTIQFRNNEMSSPKHLLDCVHWVENPDEKFPDIIKKDIYTNFYLCDSRYANHTNNPTMFKTKFYLKNISPFSGEGIDLEGKIDGWWQEQNFTVAHGRGLFTHHRIDR